MTNRTPHLLAQLTVPPPEVSIEDLLRVLSAQYKLGGTLTSLGGERDRNFHLAECSDDTEGYLVKVANPAEKPTTLTFQSAGLAHLHRYASKVPAQRQCETIAGEFWSNVTLRDNQSTAVRVFEYLPGNPIDPASLDLSDLRSIGRSVAQLDRGLQGFMHPGALQPVAWDVQRFSQLDDCLHYINKVEHRTLIQAVLKDFEKQAQPVLAGLRAQVIHNDTSFHNMVTGAERPFAISGIFDFGDMVYAPLIQEVAVSGAEFSAGRQDMLDAVAAFIAGYHDESPLTQEELSLIPVLMRARLAMSCLIESWSINNTQWIDDRAHLDDWYSNAIASLRLFENYGDCLVISAIRSACGLFPEPAQTAGTRTADSWQRRANCLGNADYISYARPIQVVRGEGAWLTDAEGNQYLDAYNNVPHVGHCHPRVVTAVAKQTATLNTNTRYLYDQLPDYAERLLSTLPDELDTCYFVSSGSEANDLAWRIAKAWTGNTGGIVMENAYHGITEASFDLSPAEHKLAGSNCPHIVQMQPPDDFRGQWKRGDAERGGKFAHYCDRAIAQLAENGHAPAAFIMDMIMSTNGVLVPPPGYLPAILEKVHGTGGLCIADEVQSGFGRLGQSMWGFELAGGTPDIVTFGKPIANGYPMGMVITRREIARCFAETALFFSTTGGNPVACAAANAVLDVIETESLQKNAEHMGCYLHDGIQGLARQFSVIGDVRGSGLFIGVDIVEPTDGITPHPAAATAIENGLQESGVLIGLDGAAENVLKIRPPMIVSEEHCQFLLTRLERVFRQMAECFASK